MGEYENGSTFRMSIDRRTILSNDQAAEVIATEKLTGEIPKEKIRALCEPDHRQAAQRVRT